MQTLNTTTTVTALGLILLFSLYLTASFPLNDTGLSNCNQNFYCGTLTNITYPFTGGQRPSHCGPPEFHLTCLTDTTTILRTTDSLSYRVIDLNQTNQTFRLSRLDFSETACTHQFINTTLNKTIFSVGPDHEILSLFYGCNHVNDSATSSYPWLSSSIFSCVTNGVSKQGFYMPSADANDPEFKPFEYCPINVQVPIPVSWAQKLWTNGSLLGEGLREGFDVSYSNPYWNDCVECYKHSGGQCRFNATLGKPICICGDKLCPGPSKTNRRLVIAIVIPATVAVIVAVIVAMNVILKHFTGRLGSSSGKTVALWWKDAKQNQKLEAFMVNYRSLTPKRYSYSDVKKMTNSFNTKLGQGGFGCVYKGKLLDGRLVAVKVLTELKTEGEEFMNEVASISRTSNVNIVTLLGFCLERNKRALIYQNMPNGSLDRFISYKGCPHANRLLEWKILHEIAVGIARGLEYLHRFCKTRIVHFDIKPHNILLDKEFRPKISDFGLAKLGKREESRVSVTGARGTAGYIAPEVFCRNFGGVSYKSDVYSYGMMILEMVGERKRTDGGLSKTSETYFPDWFYKHLEPGEISRLHEGITEENEEIARKMILVGLWCIQINPSDRPPMTKVLEMLEGSLQSMQIPPKPSFPSPERSLEELSSTTSSPPNAWSQKDEEKKASVDEADL